jgi:hypothetical protein
MPDAPPLSHDPVSEINELKTAFQDMLILFQKIEALTMSAYAIKELVSPPSFPVPVTVHTSIFRPPTFHPPAFFPLPSPTLQGNPECNFFL